MECPRSFNIVSLTCIKKGLVGNRYSSIPKNLADLCILLCILLITYLWQSQLLRNILETDFSLVLRLLLPLVLSPVWKYQKSKDGESNSRGRACRKGRRELGVGGHTQPKPSQNLRKLAWYPLQARYPSQRRRSGELKAALEGKGARVKAALTAQPENTLQCTYPWTEAMATHRASNTHANSIPPSSKVDTCSMHTL